MLTAWITTSRSLAASAAAKDQIRPSLSRRNRSGNFRSSPLVTRPNSAAARAGSLMLLQNPGTNDFHGSAFILWRPEDLALRQRIYRRPENRNSIGLGIPLTSLRPRLSSAVRSAARSKGQACSSLLRTSSRNFGTSVRSLIPHFVVLRRPQPSRTI